MPFFDKIAASGSRFSICVLAVTPCTLKPVIPFSSGGVLVAIAV